MSGIGLAFYFVFGGNVLIQWGLLPAGDDINKASPFAIIFFMSASAFAALLNGLVYRHVLTPFGLESMAPVLFALLLFGATGLFQGIRALAGMARMDLQGDRSFQATMVLYAVGMMATGRYSSTWYLLGGGAAAAFGYVAATCFLESIMARLELEPIPAPFRGAPIRFISAGLIAMAFSGVDASFFTVFYG
ncbi:MAG: hypothetical protein CVV51_09625 [Spirochaetae bacterium HGW-Spirochaetae-7]|jgi:electron transport complex protein RnfA|nr:MAG: hypothetical protein CVV51_09625 [Spirochaetae bacterium HGW-Spirochaetae-7]